MTTLDVDPPAQSGLLPATTMSRRRSVLRLAPVLRRHPWGFALTVASAAGNQGFGVAAAGVAA